MGIVAGDSGIGKTPWNYQKDVAIATGTPFFGKPTVKSRILYFDLEPGPTNFLQEFCKRIGQPIPADMFLTVQALDAPGAARNLIEQSRPDVVEFDTLRQFWPDMGKENSKAAMGFKLARQWVNEFGIFVNFTHHLRKPNRNPPPPKLRAVTVGEWFQEAEGARGLYNHADLRMALEIGDTPGVDLLVKYNYRNMGDSPLICLKRDYCEETGEAIGYSLLPISKVLSPERLDLFNQLPADRILTPRDMRKMSGLSMETVHKAIRDFQAYGVIERVGRGVYRKK